MADDLDAAIATVQGAQPAPELTGLDAAIAKVTGSNRGQTAWSVKTNVGEAANANPEQEAQARHLSGFTGWPLDTVRKDLPAARGAAALLATDADQLAADNAVTARALADPSTARLLHDDIPNTIATENAARAIGEQRGLLPDIWSGIESTSNKVGSIMNRLGNKLFGFSQENEDEAVRLARLAEEQQPTTIPGNVVAGLMYAPFGAGAPLVVGGAEGNAAAQRVFDQTGDLETAKLVGAEVGGVQALVQMLPLGRVLFRQGAGALGRSAATATLKSGAAGAAQELVGDELAATTLRGVGEDRLAEQYAPTGEKAVQAAAFNAGIHLGMQAVHAATSGATPGDIQAQAARATETQQALQEIGRLAQEGKFRGRDQEAFREFVNDASGAADLYVDARKLAEVLDQSGITGDQLRQDLPDVAAQMREGLQTEGMVRIPVADYAAKIAGGAADAGLQPHFRLSPDGMTFEEAQRAAADQAKQATDEAPGAATPPEEPGAAAFRESGEAVEKAVREQLDAADRFPADVNKQYAALARAYYEATAQRTGVLPEELFGAHPLGVRAEDLGALQQNGELMQDEPARPPRASYSPEEGAITLNKDADLSSFLHELGHHFLETHARLALDDRAPEGLRRDVEALVGDPAAWLAKALDERRDVHENFARSFEAYLLEGKAPAAGLRELFGRFRSWLVQVYRSVASLRVNLSDDVRAVMDRMLASDDAIREQQAVRGMTALFDAKPEGMSDTDFAAYRALGEAASSDAGDQLANASLRDMRWISNAKDRALREIQAKADVARDVIRGEVTKEVDALQVYRAERFIRRKEMEAPVGETREQRAAREAALAKPAKLDLAALKAMYGDGPAAPWRYLDTGKYGLAGKDGVHPDVVGELFGYGSGDELVRALLEAPARKKLVDTLTDQRMIERHGELSDPAAIERAAEAAIHNEARARVIATELRALAKATGEPSLLARAARESADALIATKRVRDLRPGLYTAVEARAARAARDAFRKGDIQEAAIQKRAQLLNNALARAAIEKRAEIAKSVEYLKKFEKASIRKGLASDFLGQIDGFLERYDLRQATGADIDRRLSLRAYVDSRINAGEMPIPAQAELLLAPAERAALERQLQSRDAEGRLVYAEADDHLRLLAEALERSQKQPYQQLTVEAFGGLVDTIKMMEHLARQQNKLLTAEGERNYQEVRDEIALSIEQHARSDGKGDRTSNTWLGQRLQALKQFGAAHIKVATWARIMDGGVDNGPVWRYLVAPANESASFETSRRAESTQALAKIWRPVLGDVPAADKLGKGRFFPTLKTSLNWQERIGLALNYGNEGNMQRLLGGGIAGVKGRLTPQDLIPVLRSLTEAEWRAVQATWDHLETFRPEVGALERRMTGAEPQWVEPRPFKITTAEGKTIALRGGYFPIVYDARGSLQAQQHADALDAKAAMRAAYSAAATQHGFTKSRVEEVNGRPLMLNMQGVYRGVNDVIHDLAWREWVRDANKLMASTTIDRRIRDHYGPEVKRELEKWRDDIVVGTRQLEHGLATFAGWLRQGVSASGLTFNIVSAALQPLGITQSIVRVGAPWIGKGIAKYAAAPIEATREANEKSEWMANRSRTRFRELNELRNTVQGQTAGRELLGRYGYWMMMRAQQLVDVPTWHGAYEKAIAAGEDDATSVRLADQAVKDSQGGGEEVDQAGIERGNALVKLFTTFYGFMNTAANIGYMNVKTERSAAKIAVSMALLYVIPAVLGDALKDALTPGDSGKWDEEHLAATLAKSQLSFLFGLITFGREFSAMVQGQDYSGPAGLRTIGDVTKLAKQVGQGEFDDSFRKAFVNVMGDLSGLPGAQINKTITGANALASGQTENPAALLTGFQQPH